LTVGGTMMMRGSREMRTVGMAIGATGVAAILSGLVRRIMDRPTATVPSYLNGIPRTGGPVGGGGAGGGLGGSVVNPPPGHYLIA